MNKSESIGALAKALSQVQAQLEPANKDAKNPFFKSNYASIQSIWDSCRKPLAENNLSVTQLTQVVESGVIIETVLMHESGEWVSGELFLPLTKNDAQGVGSALTYGRRYALAAIVGVVADEDDDGQFASRQQTQSANRNQPPQNTKTNQYAPKQENAPKSQGNGKQTASEPQATGEIVSRETLDHLISLCEQPPKRKKPCDKNEVAKHYSNKRTDMLEDLLESEAMAAIKVIENLTDK